MKGRNKKMPAWNSRWSRGFNKWVGSVDWDHSWAGIVFSMIHQLLNRGRAGNGAVFE
jgi:hypothetical protein